MYELNLENFGQFLIFVCSIADCLVKIEYMQSYEQYTKTTLYSNTKLLEFNFLTRLYSQKC